MQVNSAGMKVVGHLDGSVDRFESPWTIYGWVKNSLFAGGGRDITIQVKKGSRVLASGRPTAPRPDIIADPTYLVGFSFTLPEEVTDLEFAFGIVSVHAFDADGRERVLPVYDRARSLALERAFASAPPFGRFSASVILTNLTKSRLIVQEAREACAEINDKFFEEEDRKLLYEFESLGKDCSLGSMQRAFGAEPVGLLRFTGIGFDGVIDALRSQFTGIGDAEFTRLIADTTGEYYSSDTRYHMSSHTYVFEGNTDFDSFYRKQCQKLRFLRRNMIEKLEAGEHILVIHSIPD